MALLCIPFAIHFGIGMEQIEETKGTISPYDFTNFSLNIVVFIILGLASISLVIIEIYATIKGALKANEGELYKYPLSINFLKSSSIKSKNEQFTQH